MKKEKFFDYLAKFWQAVRNQKLWIFRMLAVLWTGVYSLGIFFFLMVLMLTLGTASDTMGWPVSAQVYKYGAVMMAIIAAAAGGYEIHTTMSWAREKAEMSDEMFDTNVIVLVLVVFFLAVVVFALIGIYKVIFLIF